MNTITTDVQQVTTRNQEKNTEWAKQDDIRKVAQAWVEKANEANAKWIRQESASTTTQIEDKKLSSNSIWQTLAECEIMLTMEKLLLLVPGFRQVVENRIRGIAGLEVLANYTKSNTGPTVVDHHNPTIKVVL